MDSVLKLSEIATWGMSKVVAEIFFIIIGIVFILVGLKALADKQFTNSKTSALFWFIVAFTFIAGPYVPKFITGLCVVLMALLTAVGKVGQSASDVPTATETRANADKLGNKIFIYRAFSTCTQCMDYCYSLEEAWSKQCCGTFSNDCVDSCIYGYRF